MVHVDEHRYRFVLNDEISNVETSFGKIKKFVGSKNFDVIFPVDNDENKICLKSFVNGSLPNYNSKISIMHFYEIAQNVSTVLYSKFLDGPEHQRKLVAVSQDLVNAVSSIIDSLDGVFVQ